MDKKQTLAMIERTVSEMARSHTSNPEQLIVVLRELHQTIQSRTAIQDSTQRTVSLTWDEVEACAENTIADEMDRAQVKAFHVRRYAAELQLFKMASRANQKFNDAPQAQAGL